MAIESYFEWWKRLTNLTPETYELQMEVRKGGSDDAYERITYMVQAICADDAVKIAKHNLYKDGIETRHCLYAAPRSLLKGRP